MKRSCCGKHSYPTVPGGSSEAVLHLGLPAKASPFLLSRATPLTGDFFSGDPHLPAWDSQKCVAVWGDSYPACSLPLSPHRCWTCVMVWRPPCLLPVLLYPPQHLPKWISCMVSPMLAPVSCRSQIETGRTQDIKQAVRANLGGIVHGDHGASCWGGPAPGCRPCGAPASL